MFSEGVLIAERYKLVSLLGRGGFSEVWLAEDVLANIKVAIKIYAPGVGLDDAGITLFTQEFSLVFDMNHTNLLHPTHFDCWQRMPFLILPYCQNGSAFKYVSPGNQISEEEAWKVLHDVASGLAYLHGKNPPIIHQDIKPDNILISDEGRYMITDFGISARVRSTLNRSAAQMSGGTLAYMGPERFGQNPQPIMASDIWSLGAMMYEMMTGNPPYGNHGGMLQKNGADIPLIEGEYSQRLLDLIYRCVALKPWERPTAEQVERETSEYLLGKTMSEPEVPASPVTPQQDKGKDEMDSLPRKDYKKWGIIGSVLGTVIIAVFLLLGGEEEPVVPDPIAPVVDYEAIYKDKLREGDSLFNSVRTKVDSAKYDNSKTGICLEDTLIKAYDAYMDAKEAKNDAGGNIDSAAMNDLMEKMAEIDRVLTDVKGYCEKGKKTMQMLNDEMLIKAFDERIQKINQFKENRDEL